MAFSTTIPLAWGQKQQDEFSLTCHPMTRCGAVPTHWHDCFEILLLLEGEHHFTVGEREYLLRPEDVLIIPPNLPHSGLEERYGILIFGYAESVIYTPENSLTGLHYLLPFRGASAMLLTGDAPALCRLRTLLREGWEIFCSDSPVRPLEMRANILHIHALLWQLYLGRDGEGAAALRYLAEAQSYIEAHLAEDISPYAIAEHLHISHGHLCRLLRTTLRRTPGELIRQCRLHLAERLLRTRPELSVTQIAESVGFGDMSYFIRCFKLEYGVPPGQFRRRKSFCDPAE